MTVRSDLVPGRYPLVAPSSFEARSYPCTDPKLTPFWLRSASPTTHMDSDGFSKAKRAELLARLAELNRLLEEQETRVKSIRDMGGDASIHEEQLQRRLKES